MKLLTEYRTQVLAMREAARPVPVSFIGGGYSKAVTLLLSLITDQRFFYPTSEKKVVVQIDGKQEISLQGQGYLFREPWMHLLNWCKTMPLNLATSEMRSLFNRDNQSLEPGDPFKSCRFHASCLSWMHDLCPYSDFYRISLVCGGSRYSETFVNGLLHTHGWEDDFDERGFFMTIHMSKEFFPAETFSVDGLNSMFRTIDFGDYGSIGTLDLVEVRSGSQLS